MPNPLKRRPSAARVEPCFAVTDLGGGEAELVLYGDVMADEPRDWWTGEPTGEQAVSTERINRELEGLRGAKHVTVRLNSCGGEVFAGVAIYNVLKSLDADVTVRIEGIAASAASVIACAGDTVVAMPGSIYMVHDPACMLYGYYTSDELDLVKQDVEASRRALCDIYVNKTGMDLTSIEQMLHAETWMVGSEIVDAGFADEYDEHSSVDEGEVEQEEGGETVIAGVHHDLRAFRHVPDLAARVAASVRRTRASAAIAARIPNPTEETTTTEPPEADQPAPVAHMQEPPLAAEEKGETFMNISELQAQHPDLVAEIQAAAAKAERDRIAEIDEIATGIPADMVADAKYGNPVSAQELAFRAMKADAAAAKQHVADAMADYEDSGAANVAAAPVPEDSAANELAEAKNEVDEAAKFLAAIKKGGLR